MKKTLITLMAIFICINCFSQTFKDYELKRLNSLGIPLNSIDTNDPIDYLNLNAILKKDKKKKTNKIIGIALTSFSALTTTFGIVVISGSKNDQEGLGQLIGGMFVAVGVVELGASIPFFTSSNRRKKERDKLIGLYNANRIEN